MNTSDIRLTKLHHNAVVPRLQTPGSAGVDLHSIDTVVIPAHGRALVKTGLAVALPPGMVGMVCSRSGLALKSGIFVMNAPGIIDSDYRNDLGVILYNSTDENFHVGIGDRIAQLVITPYVAPNFVVVDSLEETERTGGFGSTGV